MSERRKWNKNSNPPRDYQKEYQQYQGTEEQKKNRAARNAARAKMMKKGHAKKGDNRDVGHKNSNPKDNSSGNLTMESKSKNRGKMKNGKRV